MKRKLIICAAVILFLLAVLATEAEWDGDITESAAAPLADSAGVAESHILPWRIEGDLLLFVFLAGGSIAGFAAGYYWRTLFAGVKPVEPSAAPPKRDDTTAGQGSAPR